jgi:Glucose / Sorbosone dehydrogenase
MAVVDLSPRLAALAALALCLALAGCADADPARIAHPPGGAGGDARTFDLARVADGLVRPVWVGAAPGDPDALWVLEQPGRAVRIAGGRRARALDMSARVRTGGEQGLLGIAFHPGFATNGRAFVHYTDRAGDTRVEELRARAGGTALRPRPVRRLLHVEQPEPNHNGGHLAFGPDGRLYLGLGDGGGAFDPRRAAQDPGRLLGKILAADVDAAAPRWEVVARGLRNPWRFAFDPAVEEMWIGDVGQDAVEEVNRIRLEPDEPPPNLGWSAYEGRRRLPGHAWVGPGEPVFPVAGYGHDEGCSITGGVVYSGVALPALSRRYLYGDFCSGALWSLRGTPDLGAEDVRREGARVPQLTHIGEDGHGEVVLASGTGSILRAVPPAPPPP